MITKEQYEKLQKIIMYFGKGSKSDALQNKKQRLCSECGEVRDSVLFNFGRRSYMKEVTDVLSCALQIYMNDSLIREQFNKTLDETIEKIENGYYK